MTHTQSNRNAPPKQHEQKGPARLLLINPFFSESVWSFRWAMERVLPDKDAINAPLGLAALAALCPPSWETRIYDENVEWLPPGPKADVVGVCGIAVQHPRQREILSNHSDRGYYVIAGGSYASLYSERFGSLGDAVLANEAEYISLSFCRDIEAGSLKARYQEQAVVDLGDSPTPRFDLIDLRHYTTASLQCSRGCPDQREFCDSMVMFDRWPAPRHRSGPGANWARCVSKVYVTSCSRTTTS